MRGVSIYELTRQLYRDTSGKLEHISGKWFYDKKEIYDIRRYLYQKGVFSNVSELDKFIDSYITLYSKVGNWYQLPIIEEARNYTPHELAYPLTLKQLKLINYIMRHDEEVFFILTGVGGSGKSTFANIICSMFDARDRASLSLSDLGEDFKLATAINKRLIYSTEINSEDINNGKLKQLFSNEEITINGKNQTPYQTRCQSAFFFNCNKAPRLDLSDTGMLRRILYYKMDTKIENPDPTLNHKEWSHDDLLNILATAMRVDMTDWKLDFEQETRECLVKDNSVYRFREYNDYDTYSMCCKNQGLRAFSQPKWEEIRELLGEWGYLSTMRELDPKERVDLDAIFGKN